MEPARSSARASLSQASAWRRFSRSWQLAGVADQDNLGRRLFGGSEEAGELACAYHAGLDLEELSCRPAALAIWARCQGHGLWVAGEAVRARSEGGDRGAVAM